MREKILDMTESLLNSPFTSFCIGVLLIEWGLSRWQGRKFSKTSLITVFLIAFGVRSIFKGLF
jgi:hypothetical protein